MKGMLSLSCLIGLRAVLAPAHNILDNKFMQLHFHIAFQQLFNINIKLFLICIYIYLNPFNFNSFKEQIKISLHVNTQGQV